MLDKKMEDQLNKQVNAELYSAYMYQSMSSYLEDSGLSGMAHWMSNQAIEEMVHAKKIYDFIIERGGRALLTAIEGPPTEWKSPLDLFENAYKHETKVTGMINDLVNLAIELKDHATNQFLQWFVAEQVEEEASADEIVQKLKIIGDGGQGMFMLDKELGQRVAKVFPPPPSAEE